MLAQSYVSMPFMNTRDIINRILQDILQEGSYSTVVKELSPQGPKPVLTASQIAYIMDELEREYDAWL